MAGVGRYVPPPPPQNPNRGPNAVPAPDRPAPQPDWDRNAGRWDLSQGWDTEITSEDILRYFQRDPFAPDELRDLDLLPRENPFPDESRNPGGDSRRRGHCDDSVGENVNRNIVYLPRERFREGPEGCRATGIVAQFRGSDDTVGGTGTAWNNNFTTGMITPPDYWKLPEGNRARGHLAGKQFGGSGTDLRNLVPLYSYANSQSMKGIENGIASSIKAGQDVTYVVTPVYNPNEKSGIPDYIHMQAWGSGGLNVDCHVYNVSTPREPVCLKESYGR